jgi:Acetyltransferase (GNAT) domain
VGHKLFTLDPLTDPRWPRFVLSHPAASICHTSGWLRALQRTYDYRPVVLTTSAPGEELTSGVVFCQIDSWLTGRRLVSLPFSDHCEPLARAPQDVDTLMGGLMEELRRQGCSRLEVRPIGALLASNGLERSQEFVFHKLDLRDGRESVFRRLHKDCVQRKIRRAQREGLTWERGHSTVLLNQFYRLLVISRRRQHLPPQPHAWFRNLIDCLGDQVNIGVASKDRQPIAAVMTLRFRDVLTYKYGCSDHRLHRFGGVQLLLWKAIERAISMGLRELDMGRSDLDSPGLITFKDRWAAARSRLVYWTSSAQSAAKPLPVWRMNAARKIFSHAPTTCLTFVGNLLYKHIG